MAVIQTYRTATVDFEAIKGDSFNQTIQFTDENGSPVNLSVYTYAKMQLKEAEYSNSVWEFTSTGITNQIILTGSTVGIITIVGEAITLTPYQYLYDLQFNNTTTVETIAKGRFKIIQDITS
jgi:hypothetical protein